MIMAEYVEIMRNHYNSAHPMWQKLFSRLKKTVRQIFSRYTEEKNIVHARVKR